MARQKFIMAILAGSALLLMIAGSRSTYLVASEQTPLATAARAGELELVEQAIAAGADVNHRDTLMGKTPLHWAVSLESEQAYPKRNRLAIVQTLLRNGADPNRTNSSTQAPLDEAVWNPDLVEELLRAGASPEGGSRGRTALTSAAYFSAGDMCFRTAESMRHMLKAGANVNAQEPGSKWTPLLTAVIYGCPEMVQVLLAGGADPNAKSRLGETVLKTVQRFDADDQGWTGKLTMPAAALRQESLDLVRKAGGHL